MARRTLRRLQWAGLLLLILLAIAVAGLYFAFTWHPSRSHYHYQGVDVSSDDGAIDWPMVAAGGADFAYIRATMGADRRDPKFEENWQAVDSAGMRRGAIHIFSLCRLADDQAANFVRTVPHSDNALPAALLLDFQPDCDARPDRAVVLEQVRTFLTLAERRDGKPMLIDISRRFEHHYHLTADLPRPIWASQPFFPPDYTARPWRMWRATPIRRVDGIDHVVHWDVVRP